MKNIDLNNKVQLLIIGKEETPVIVIDDFSPEPQKCIELAVKESFIPDPDRNVYYPGIRAFIRGEYGNSLLEAIAELVRNVYKVPTSFTLFPHAGNYSLVSQPEEQLEFLQTFPHFDSVKPNYFAVMHYLNPGEFGGTGIYRHKPTGYENITEERLSNYIDVAQNFIDTHEKNDPKYFTGSTDHFELIHKLDYKQNRLVIYPGNLLHSAFIDDCSRDLSSDPKTGRLTANFFIYFE